MMHTFEYYQSLHRRILTCVAALCLLVVSLAVPSVSSLADNDYTEGPGAEAEAYIVYNPDTGEIITGKNIHEKHYPASITKIMTALLVLEHCYNLDDVVTFSHAAVTNITSDSSTLIPVAKEGEQMSLRDVLYGMFLSSGNECANMLAEYVSGSTEAFCQLMNERAAMIGATNTHFMNAHGLHDDNHYTTPYDMALIFTEALQNPAFKALASTKEYTIPATNMTETRNLTMGHQMVIQAPGYLCEGVFAGKTGRTPQAGRTLVTGCERNGVTLISVVMKTGETKHYTDTMGLLNYAYDVIEGELTETRWTEKTEEVKVIGTTNGVNVRQFATVDSDIIGRIPEGEVVTRVATWDQYWSRILYEGAYYYVHSAYVTPVEDTEPSTEETETPEDIETPEETETETENEPETAPEASVSVILPPGIDETSEVPTMPPSEETTAEEEESTEHSSSQAGDVPTESSGNAGVIQSGESKLLKRIIVVCVILMIVVLVLAILPVFLPKRRKHHRSASIHHHDDWYQQ